MFGWTYYVASRNRACADRLVRGGSAMALAGALLLGGCVGDKDDKAEARQRAIDRLNLASAQIEFLLSSLQGFESRWAQSQAVLRDQAGDVGEDRSEAARKDAARTIKKLQAELGEERVNYLIAKGALEPLSKHVLDGPATVYPPPRLRLDE